MAKRRLNLSTAEAVPSAVAPVQPSNQGDEKKETVSASIDKRIGEFQDQQEQIKPKRKYTRKASAPEDDAKKIEDQKKQERIDGLRRDFAMLASSVLEIACKRLPNPLPATEDEKELFGRCASNVAVKYMDSFDYGEETALIIATGIILIPRFMKSEEESKQTSLAFIPSTTSDIP